MTIRIISDREVTLQMQIDVQGKALQKAMNEALALKAERDEYQQAADKMAMEHKVERDTLRQQLAEAQALIEASRKQEPVAWQYQSKTGLWTPFLSEQHKNEMMIFSPGPIRSLFAAPVVADDVRDFAKRYWNACNTSEPIDWMNAALEAQRLLNTSNPNAITGAKK